MTYAYPYDPNAMNPENIIPDEHHTLNPRVMGSDEFNFIVPRLAPFFRTGLKLYHVGSDTPLIEGVDYVLGHKFEVPDEVTEKDIYGSISFIDIGLRGQVRIGSYRTLGGPFNIDEQEILTILAQESVDPRSVHWNDITTPPEFPPSPHLDDAEELFGLQALIDELHALHCVLSGGSSNAHTHEMSQINGLLDELTNRVSNRGAGKLLLGKALNILNHDGSIGVRIPHFRQAIDLEIVVGFIGAGGVGEASFHVSIPKKWFEEGPEADLPVLAAVGTWKSRYLSDRSATFVFKRPADSNFNKLGEGINLFITMGLLERHTAFIKSVSMNTTNSGIYTDDWSLFLAPTETYAPGASTGEIMPEGGGTLSLDYDQTGTLKPYTCWMVESNTGTKSRALPLKAPNNAIIRIRDDGYSATVNNAVISGRIKIKNQQEVSSLELDDNGGWFDLQYKSITETWHMVAGN